MLGLATKKDIKKIERDLEITSDTIKKDITNITTSQKDNITYLSGKIKEVEKLVRDKVHEPSPRTSTEKHIKKVVNDQKLLKAIHSCIKEGYSTNRIREDIMLRFGIGKTKFFKYLNLVRDKVHEPSPRTSIIKIKEEGKNI